MSYIDEEKTELCKRLWDECKDDLTKLCKYKLSSHPDEVEDVIADAFYYLCVAVFKNRKIDNYKAWLVAVTHNLIKKKYTEINHMKKSYISFYEENIEENSYDGDRLFDSFVSDSMIEQLSDSIISNLSGGDRLLYIYVYQDKLKMREIAGLMNITENNVRQRNHRLGKKLKVLIKDRIEEVLVDIN